MAGTDRSKQNKEFTSVPFRDDDGKKKKKENKKK
jgi:hypothetical protein